MTNPSAPPITAEMLEAPITPNGGPHRALSTQILVRPARIGDLAGVQYVAQVCEQMKGFNHDDWSPVILIAEFQDQVIGLIQALPAKPVAVVTAFGVLPEHRGSRAAYKLIEGVELALRLAGCRGWVAYALADNPTWRETITKYVAVTSNVPLCEFSKTL